MNPVEFFDGVASPYDCQRAFYRALASALADELPPGFRPSRILEVGSGTGHSTSVLAERFPGAALTALEPAPTMAALGRKNVPTAEWHPSELGSYLAKDSSLGGFDLVFSSAAAHWLDDQEWQRLLEESRESVLALALPVSDLQSGLPLPAGNELVLRLLRHMRPRPGWRAAARRRARTRNLAASPGCLRTAMWRNVETWQNGRDLAETLHCRGALLALFGEDSARVFEELSSQTQVFEFAWSFLLMVRTPALPLHQSSES
jgi:SAM-dependent methyltransferase